MKKELKNIMKLTNKVEGSLPFPLGSGTKRLVIPVEAGKVGLIAVLASTPLMWSIKLGLNFTSFIAGIAGTLKKIIPAPASSFLGVL